MHCLSGCKHVHFQTWWNNSANMLVFTVVRVLKQDAHCVTHVQCSALKYLWNLSSLVAMVRFSTGTVWAAQLLEDILSLLHLTEGSNAFPNDFTDMCKTHPGAVRFPQGTGDYEGVSISRELFVGRVWSALIVAGIQAYQFAGHSFRIGAASTAPARGAEDFIKTLRRWRSCAYLLYVRIPRELDSLNGGFNYYSVLITKTMAEVFPQCEVE